jgi:hypothetical protein
MAMFNSYVKLPEGIFWGDGNPKNMQNIPKFNDA